jgi:hypothetical protein
VGLINQAPTQYKSVPYKIKGAFDKSSPCKEYFLSFPFPRAYKSNAKNINAVGLMNQAPT